MFTPVTESRVLSSVDPFEETEEAFSFPMDPDTSSGYTSHPLDFDACLSPSDPCADVFFTTSSPLGGSDSNINNLMTLREEACSPIELDCFNFLRDESPPLGTLDDWSLASIARPLEPQDHAAVAQAIERKAIETLIEKFRAGPLYAEGDPPFPSVRAWLKEAETSTSTEVLHDLLQALSSRIRKAYPFPPMSTPFEVDVPVTLRLIGMALFSGTVQVDTPEQKAVQDAATKLYNHILQVINLFLAYPKLGNDCHRPMGEECILEITFEATFEAAVSSYNTWVTSFTAQRTSDYMTSFENLLRTVDQLHNVQPRFARYALDDIVAMSPHMQEFVPLPQMKLAVDSILACRMRYFVPSPIVCSKQEENTFIDMVRGDISFEMMHELTLNREWTFDNVRETHHVYAPVQYKGSIPIAYQSVILAHVEQAQWDTLRVDLVLSRDLSGKQDTFLTQIIRSISYFLLRVMQTSPSNRRLSEIVVPTRLRENILARGKEVVEDCKKILLECGALFDTHVSQEVRTAIKSALEEAKQCVESTDRAQQEAKVAAFTVFFLSHLYAVVVDANYAFLSKTLASARATDTTDWGQLCLLEAAVTCKCIRGYLKLTNSERISPSARVDPKHLGESFFPRTLVDVKLTVPRLPVSILLSIEKGHDDTGAARDVLAYVLMSTLPRTRCSCLSQAFPEVFYMDDTRLAFVSRELYFLTGAAVVITSMYANLMDVPEHIRILANETLSVDTLIEAMGSSAEKSILRKRVDEDGLNFTRMYARIESLFLSAVLGNDMVSTRGGCPGPQSVGLRAGLVLWTRMKRCFQLLQSVHKVATVVYGKYVTPFVRAEVRQYMSDRRMAVGLVPLPEQRVMRKRLNAGVQGGNTLAGGKRARKDK